MDVHYITIHPEPRNYSAEWVLFDIRKRAQGINSMNWIVLQDLGIEAYRTPPKLPEGIQLTLKEYKDKHGLPECLRT